MVYYREKQIDDAFFALSHPVRRGVIERLVREDLSVAQVSKSFEESPSQMTKHLHILERAGFLSRKREGRVHRLHYKHGPLDEMMEWVIRNRKFWESRFDALESYLHKISEKK
jgi:DNA-binding transcriptional ArsR family regulator